LASYALSELEGNMTSKTVPTPESIQASCTFPEKGERRYAKVNLESGLQLAFIRTSGRRNEPLEAWYVSNETGTLRIQEEQVLSLLKLWNGGEITTQRN
jgi:hypothetical protein